MCQNFSNLGKLVLFVLLIKCPDGLQPSALEVLFSALPLALAVIMGGGG